MARSKEDLSFVPRETKLPSWLVTLNCPTPLAKRSLQVEAATEEEAKEAFCRENGISGSVHAFEVKRV